MSVQPPSAPQPVEVDLVVAFSHHNRGVWLAIAVLAGGDFGLGAAVFCVGMGKGLAEATAAAVGVFTISAGLLLTAIKFVTDRKD